MTDAGHMDSAELAAVMTVLDHAGDLKVLPRTGWLLAGISRPESVAAHSFSVALLTLALAELINLDPAAEALDEPIRVERALRLALLHDLGESRITDLPKRTTELIGDEVKRQAEASAMRMILGELPQGPAALDLWIEYIQASSPEARLVKDADKLEMVHQALRYERTQGVELDEFLHGHRWYYGVSQRLFAALRSRRTSRTLAA